MPGMHFHTACRVPNAFRVALVSLVALAVALPVAAADGGQHLEIKEWPIPWPDSSPHDPHGVSPEAVWFAAEKGNYLGMLNPRTGRFSRIDLVDTPAPRAIVPAANGMLWYAASALGYLGRYDLRSRTIYRGPLTDAVSDPTALTFEAGERNIWFTAKESNIIGRFRLVNAIVDLQRLPTPNAAPDGIAVAPKAGPPWVALSGTNTLASIDPRTFVLTVRTLPRKQARPRRLAFTSDGRLWYVDFAEGFLGAFIPGDKASKEWPMPGGKASKPLAIAVDGKDRVWVMQTGTSPATLVGFDPKTQKFFSETPVTSGGGLVSEMSFDAASGGIWFATEKNTIGFARIPD